jgi:serine/threonine protein kinase
MAAEESLDSLGIAWTGSPARWHVIPRTSIPVCGIQGDVRDCSNTLLFTLKAKHALGSGTFGSVDAFFRSTPDGNTKVVAMKRPKHPQNDLFIEALFQWKLHNDLKDYNLSFCIPRVYDIVRYKPTDDIMFTMESYEPVLLSTWCVQHITKGYTTLFGLILLQIALILEVLENELQVDHRDLKVNNILVIEEKTTITITFEGKEKELIFPFKLVVIDFGFACKGKVLDVREGDGLPTMDLCPKDGRDLFQVIVSLWSIETLRGILEPRWGTWVRQRIESAKKGTYVRLAETSKTLDWMHIVTEDRFFRAPLCTPWSIIQDCIHMLDSSK